MSGFFMVEGLVGGVEVVVEDMAGELDTACSGESWSLLTALRYLQRGFKAINGFQSLRGNYRHRVGLGPPQQPQVTHCVFETPGQLLRHRKQTSIFRRPSVKRPPLDTQSPNPGTNDNNPPHLYLRRRNPHLHRDRPDVIPRSPSLPRHQGQTLHPHNRPTPPPPTRAKRSPRPKPQLPNPRP